MSRLPSRIARNGRRLGITDPAFRQAKTEGYVARSAYKLLEIQQKHKLIPLGGSVLDLGCHPGAWLQVACQSLGPPSKGGIVVGVDLQATSSPGRFCDDRVKIVQADARALRAEFWRQYCPKGFHVVLSDMCHFTHGNTVVDAYKSLELARTAFEIAISADGPFQLQVEEIGESQGNDIDNFNDHTSDVLIGASASSSQHTHGGGVLRSGGSLVMKLLQGPGTQEFAAELRPHFTKVAWHRPKATRSESKEVFLLGLKRKS
jgi:23S rRNA (uridine2552-2'-O)-methyltransferase